MSQSNYNPPRRGRPRRIQPGGTRVKEDGLNPPADSSNSSHTNPPDGEL